MTLSGAVRKSGLRLHSLVGLASVRDSQLGGQWLVSQSELPLMPGRAARFADETSAPLPTSNPCSRAQGPRPQRHRHCAKPAVNSNSSASLSIGPRTRVPCNCGASSPSKRQSSEGMGRQAHRRRATSRTLASQGLHAVSLPRKPTTCGCGVFLLQCNILLSRSRRLSTGVMRAVR